METAATQLSDDIRKYDLKRYVLELETDGLTIVPPKVTGVSEEFLDRCTEVLLNRFTEMTGSPITLGLHADQGLNPLPWGRIALTANATWCLTDYTKEDGALAYVPGSHKKVSRPEQPMAAKAAVPAEGPRGSVIIFQGATWHGAFPKKTPGLRLCAVCYYRHIATLPQENLKVTMQNEPYI